MNSVRNIGSINQIGYYPESKIIYNSIYRLEEVVCEFIKNSPYRDEKFRPNPNIILLNTNESWDKCIHIKVKNRVPYIIEITTFSPNSFYISLYSKKSIEKYGYSYTYLDSNVLKELNDYIIANQDKERDVETIEKKVQLEINIGLFALIFWLGVIILALNGKADLFKIFASFTMVYFGLYMIRQGIKNVKK